MHSFQAGTDPTWGLGGWNPPTPMNSIGASTGSQEILTTDEEREEENEEEEEKERKKRRKNSAPFLEFPGSTTGSKF